MIPDAIIKLIETPKGQRPLRTVVDGMTGAIVEKANHEVKQGYVDFLTAFGMKDMVN